MAILDQIQVAMGAFSPVPCFIDQDMFHVEQTIVQPIINAMKRRETPFIGCLYPGLMVTPMGLRVLEFNCRFGDPETQVLMVRTEGDLFHTLKHSYEQQREIPALTYRNEYAVCVNLCSTEYPASTHTPVQIYGIEKAIQLSDKIWAFHGATKLIDGKLYTDGGRVLSVVAAGETLESANILAYKACELIEFHGKQYRRDIVRL